MSRTDILSEIKEAEAKADAMVVEAEASKKNAIADARRDSVKKIQTAEAEMLDAYGSAMAQKNAELAEKRASMIANGNKETVAIENAAKDRIQEVKDFLRKEFEETINVTS